MNPAARFEPPRETDPVPELGSNPSVDGLLQEFRSREQPPPRTPLGPYVPDERPLETFVGGAGV